MPGLAYPAMKTWRRWAVQGGSGPGSLKLKKNIKTHPGYYSIQFLHQNALFLNSYYTVSITIYGYLKFCQEYITVFEIPEILSYLTVQHNFEIYRNRAQM